jgi:hypothetical protein
MSDLREQLDGVVDKIRTAHREVGADDGASPVLVAVVREFEAKAEKAGKAVVGDGRFGPTSRARRPSRHMHAQGEHVASLPTQGGFTR